MRILATVAQAELTVQKSKFLGILQPVTTPEGARELLKEAKGRYVDATHVVHAFRVGAPGSETLGCSDDGEPSGTAGRPVLDVLQGAGGGNALLLVVRWFGGTKLGTGGLVKAYGDTAKAVIAAGRWDEYRAYVRAHITLEWSDLRPVKKEMEAASGTLDSETFAEVARIVADIPQSEFDELQRKTVNLTRGRSRWTLQESP